MDVRLHTAEAATNFSTVFGPCSHSGTVPVETIDRERVAVLRLDCDTQLPATWKGSNG